ncbi:TetR/AcrR family transcriptional regulator [Zhouia spongiae]|uniref:TetR/AcrR family transcriptional regulator n=1 Tax=Zhouia spongiae TaxID=2202721 RepID=A0ABY3YNN6_9FLAO|nr:TetR/AcrR family transcriptional regulator [Zhouia spongiae]UNY99434.1 TetR/AcrR family transcriptional regulator [Zhouia spongiae]
MKDKIIEKASDMFLTIGFKSITMDDIANEMGISKKTIYQHFRNKTELVESCTMHRCDYVTNGINCIRGQRNNPIEELYEIKGFVLSNLKDEKSSPYYQLQKYYPKVHKALRSKIYDQMDACILENLKRGVDEGIFRKEIDVDIISKFYFYGMMELKNGDVFSPHVYSMPYLMEVFLDYYVRGIATEKGILILNQIINSNNDKK